MLPLQPGTEVMTAGNSSPLCDGASEVVLASAQQTQALDTKSLPRLLARASAAVGPAIRGIALARAIERAGITPQDVGAHGIHEALVAQVLEVVPSPGPDRR